MDFKIICPNCKSDKVEVFSTVDMEVVFICQNCGHRETTDDA
ncbi:hypothetical protein [Priestia megaterium]|nr:hypothetical protein [Priestia megaterium]